MPAERIGYSIPRSSQSRVRSVRLATVALPRARTGIGPGGRPSIGRGESAACRAGALLAFACAARREEPGGARLRALVQRPRGAAARPRGLGWTRRRSERLAREGIAQRLGLARHLPPALDAPPLPPAAGRTFRRALRTTCGRRALTTAARTAPRRRALQAPRRTAALRGLLAPALASRAGARRPCVRPSSGAPCERPCGARPLTACHGVSNLSWASPSPAIPRPRRRDACCTSITLRSRPSMKTVVPARTWGPS
jgi:hypothetical protein